ncbi:tripartite motif-containing protein 16-like protein isoform X2 [Danio aesculapii]|uniref:tripartite motif-containing protein 16-like protein isoform X2 n=1 Tax=Danio aesculapii TaxID=1142201 RepID=UPI0024C0CD58|nr:tripartite motif-containing protein 16-like protein isoform X2 [Danio aesculapii]
MAEEEAGIFVNQEQFSCPICMDLLRDPVTIPCGHNYCMECIKSFWEQKSQRKLCSCPECRQSFNPRPALNKNTLFAEVVEKMRHTGIRSPTLPAAAGAKGDQDTAEEKLCEKFCESSAQEAVEATEKIFSELIHSIEALCFEVTEMIKEKEQAELDEAHGFMEKLEQEIAEFKRRDADYERLAQLEDKTQFLKGYEMLCSLPKLLTSPAVLVNPDFCFEMVARKLTYLNEDIKDLCQKKLGKLSKKVTNLKFIPTPEPKVREQFLEYSGHLTLDLNTAHKNLIICPDNVQATFSKTYLSVPDHPERFDSYYQVLCRESVSGRCYFETDWTGKGPVHIAVSYEDISRKGKSSQCAFGHNAQSWSLVCSEDSYAFWHNGRETKIPKTQLTHRIGVYVDYSAGVLAFYSITDSMNLIHRIWAAFAQPLYPGFRINPGSNVCLCYPL